MIADAEVNSSFLLADPQTERKNLGGTRKEKKM
jgi:hypothetical protein